MIPGDPRHGTRRGYYAHRRDGEPACDACKRGAATAEARYQLNRAHGKQAAVDSTGTLRRIQALAALGWTFRELDRHIEGRRNFCGPLIYDNPRLVRAVTAAKVVDLYERFSMRLPPEDMQRQRTNALRARSLASRNGWPPPLAWDDIDDPDERPRGWQHSGPDRAAELRDLDAQRAGISEVCRRLRITRKTLEKWCERHDLTPLYSRFVDREQTRYWRNGGAEGGVA